MLNLFELDCSSPVKMDKAMPWRAEMDFWREQSIFWPNRAIYRRKLANEGTSLSIPLLSKLRDKV
jgi:hypothetical protein